MRAKALQSEFSSGSWAAESSTFVNFRKHILRIGSRLDCRILKNLINCERRTPWAGKENARPFWGRRAVRKTGFGRIGDEARTDFNGAEGE